MITLYDITNELRNEVENYKIVLQNAGVEKDDSDMRKIDALLSMYNMCEKTYADKLDDIIFYTNSKEAEQLIKDSRLEEEEYEL